jgi:transcriptional regulator with XRE-family HTH domain
MIIAERIKELRVEKGMSQAQLAEMVGCSQPMITLWEKGECEPTATAIIKLSEALNCSTDYLLGKTNY